VTLAPFCAAFAALFFPQASPPASFSPAQLLELPLPAEARLGVALERAARGDLAGAQTAVAELAEAAETALPRDRLEREAARLAAFAAARTRFLERCLAEKRKLRLELDGKAVVGVVAEVAADRLTLADARGRPVEAPIAAVNPLLLLQKSGELGIELGDARTRAFAALLAGRAGWSKGLDAASAEDAALAADGAQDFGLIGAGAASAALLELARAPLPADAPAAERTLATLKTLLESHAKEAVVVARRDLLRQLARVALARRFDARGLEGAGLAAKVVALDGGRIRLVYEFADAKELDDFAATAQLHPSWDAFEILLPKEKWAHGVANDALRLVGRGCLRHRLTFDGPLHVEYRIQYGSVGAGLSGFATARIALADDGEGTMVTNLDLACVDAIDGRTRASACSDPAARRTPADPAQLYDVELDFDGATAELKVGGRPGQRLEAGLPARGDVAIYWKSDASIQIARLVIEGRLAPGGLALLREEFVAREARALFGE
jgi:hypothetical protein